MFDSLIAYQINADATKVVSVVANEARAGSIPVIRSNLASPMDLGRAPSKRTVAGSNPAEASNILAVGRYAASYAAHGSSILPQDSIYASVAE